MFCKASLLALVTLALSSVATPIKRADGVTIPIAKRRSLTTAEGVFDADAALRQTVALKNKHRQNLINLERNVGKQAFPKGASILPLATLPDHIQKRQSEKLTDQDQDEEWTGSISIGTPAQKFVIDVDTGSSDLWVPSSSCTSSTCSGKSKYKASSSSTSKKQSGTFSISYGDGSSVSGPEYTDTVSLAGIKVTGQYFSPVTTLSSEFKGDPADGLLGLAFPAISNLGQNPFFNNAFQQGTASSNEFGMKLASSGSELYVGGVDSSLYSGSLEYHDIDTSTGFWQVTGASALSGSTTVVSGFDTIIDSGTTIMYGPPSAVKELYAKIPGTKEYDTTNGYYSFPCDSVPSISFSWGGKNWEISADNLNLGQTSSGSSTCTSALAAQDLGLGDNTWLLGDSFIKNAYVSFSFAKNAVGFAELS